MILRTARGNRELRMAEFGSSLVPTPLQFGGYYSESGDLVTLDAALGIPAFIAANRLVSETVASMPIKVYRGSGPDREEARDSWQWDLLHRRPNEVDSPFDFISDTVSAIESYNNAYALKAKSRKRVEALLTLDPKSVEVRQDGPGGEKVFRVASARGVKEFSSRDILHIRGWTPGNGMMAGPNLLRICKDAVGVVLASQGFLGRYFRRDARPGIVFKFPQGVNSEQGKAWLDLWNSEHQGPENQHAPGVLGGGGEVEVIPIALKDMELERLRRFLVEEIARVARIPATLIGESQGTSPTGATDETERFYKFYLLPRLRRIESALAADPDVFPGDDLFCEFLADGLLRPDTHARYDAYRLARQGGWVTANEIRGIENYPPLPGGDELLQTPVGGAPNDSPPPSKEE